MITALPTQPKWCQVFFQFVQANLASGLSDAMQCAVVVGALADNGLTAIANKGNPARETILARLFPSGIRPLELPGRRRRPKQTWVNAIYARDDVSGKT